MFLFTVKLVSNKNDRRTCKCILDGNSQYFRYLLKQSNSKGYIHLTSLSNIVRSIEFVIRAGAGTVNACLILNYRGKRHI
jgi:hypothetical protein